MGSESKYQLESLEPRVLLSIDTTGAGLIVSSGTSVTSSIEQQCFLDNSQNDFHDNTYNVMSSADSLFDQTLYQNIFSVVDNDQNTPVADDSLDSQTVTSDRSVEEVQPVLNASTSSASSIVLATQYVAQAVSESILNNSETRVITLDAANAPPKVSVMDSAAMRVLTLDASNAPPAQVVSGSGSIVDSQESQLQEGSNPGVGNVLSIELPRIHLRSAVVSTKSTVNFNPNKPIINVNELPSNNENIIIGSPDYNSIIEIGSPDQNDNNPVLLTGNVTIMAPMPGGEVHINSPILGSAGVSFVIYGSGHTTTYSAGIITGGDIIINDSVIIDGDVTLRATGSVYISGSITGKNDGIVDNLIIEAGTTVELLGDIGGSGLSSVSVDAAGAVNVGGNVAVDGDVFFASRGASLVLGGNIASLGGSVSLVSGLLLSMDYDISSGGGDISIVSSAGIASSIGGYISSAGSGGLTGVSGGEILIKNAGVGNILLLGNIDFSGGNSSGAGIAGASGGVATVVNDSGSISVGNIIGLGGLSTGGGVSGTSGLFQVSCAGGAGQSVGSSILTGKLKVMASGGNILLDNQANDSDSVAFNMNGGGSVVYVDCDDVVVDVIGVAGSMGESLPSVAGVVLSGGSDDVDVRSLNGNLSVSGDVVVGGIGLGDFLGLNLESYLLQLFLELDNLGGMINGFTPFDSSIPVINKSINGLFTSAGYKIGDLLKFHDALATYFALPDEPEISGIVNAIKAEINPKLAGSNLGASLTYINGSPQLIFDVSFDINPQFGVNFDLGPFLTALGLESDGVASVSLQSGIAIDIAFGIDLNKLLDGGIPIAETVFFILRNMDIDVLLDLNNINIGMDTGFLQTDLNNASIDVNTGANIKLNGIDQKLYLSDISGKSFDEIFTVQLSDAEIELVVEDVSMFAGQQGTGLLMTVSDLGLVMLGHFAQDDTTGELLAPSWTYAMTGIGTGSLIGINDISLQGNVKIRKNTTGQELDKTLGVSDQIAVKFLADEGNLENIELTGLLRLHDFIFICGTFVYQNNGAVDITPVGSETSTNVKVIQIGANSVHAFAGIGGPYWDSNADGIIDGSDTPDANSLGVAFGNISFGLAIMTPTAALNNSRYYALKATGNAALVGLNNLTLAYANAEMTVNKAFDKVSGDPVAVVDYTKLTDGKMLVPVGSGLDDMELDFAGEMLKTSGNATIGISEYLYISGKVAFEKGDNQTVTLADNTTKEVKVIKIGGHGIYAFAGIGGPYWVDNNSDGVYETQSAQALGVALSNVAFGLALMRPSADADTKRYYALKSTGSVSVVGIPDITIQADDFNLEANGASLGDAVDFTKLVAGKLIVPTGTGTPEIELDYSSSVLRASGTGSLGLSNYIYISGSLAFEKGSVEAVTLADNTTKDVKVIKIGGHDIHAFAGLGGPYWRDSTGNDVIDGADTPMTGSMGLALNSVTFGLALMRPLDAADTKRYYALKASGNVSLIGISDMTIQADKVKIDVNSASAGPVIDFTKLAGGNLLVPTGSGSPDIALDYNVAIIKASAYLTLGIKDYVYLSGNFAFEKGAVESIKLVGDTAFTEMGVVKIGGNNIRGFVGAGGPYWVDSNHDGVIDGTDTPVSGGAIGLIFNNINFGLALLKPTDLLNNNRYYALKSEGSAAVVGISGLDLALNEMTIEVNKTYNTQGEVITNVIDFTNLTDGKMLVTTGSGSPDVELDFDNELLRAGGNVTLGIQNYIYVCGDFSFEQGTVETVTLSDNSTKEVKVLKVGASNVYGFAGIGGPYWVDSEPDGDIDNDDTPSAAGAVGLILNNVGFGLALMRPTDSADLKKYYALKATGSVSLVGIPGLTLQADEMSFEVNSASEGPVIDFTKLADEKMIVSTGNGTSEVELDFSSQLLRARGNVTLGISDYIYVSGNFTFEKGSIETVTLTDASTKDVSVIKVGGSSIYGFAGIGGPYWVDSDNDGKIDGTDTPATAGAMGLALTNVSFGLALMKPTDAEDVKKYYALKASGGVSLVGMSDITLTATSISLEANGASAGDVVDFTELAGGKMLIPTGAADIELDYDEAVLRASGTVTLGIREYIYLCGSFAFEKGGKEFVTLEGSTTSTEITVLKIGGSNIYAFAGVGGPYWVDSNTDGKIDGADTPVEGALGVALNNVAFGLALMRPTDVADVKKYYALKATGGVSLIGISDITLTANSISLEVNGASEGAVIDFTKLADGKMSVPTGAGNPEVTLDYSSSLLRASGNLTLGISEYVYIAGDFAFEKGGVELVTLADNTTKNVTVIKIGGANIYAFVGLGGPYWFDSNHDGKIDGTDTPTGNNAIGLVLNNVSFGLALMKPTNGADAEKYYALKATGAAALLGIPDITLQADSLQIDVNGASEGSVVDFTKLAGGKMTVPTGTETPTVDLDYAGALLRASANVTIAISDYVFVSGNFAFEKGEIATVILSDNTTKEVSVLKVGGSHVYVFAGIGGPYWTDANNDGTYEANPTGAIGIALSNVAFGLAILNSTANDGNKYYALKASGSAALVGVDSVTIQADNLLVEVNGTRAGPDVVDFSKLAGGKMSVPTGSGTPDVDLTYSTSLLRASGSIAITIAGQTLSGNFFFEKSVNDNGGNIIKVGVSDIHFSFLDGAEGAAQNVISLTNGSGVMVITDKGIAAQISIDVALTIPNPDPVFSFNSTVSLAISNSTSAIKESFEFNGDPIELDLPEGPYVRILLDNTTLTIAGIALTGTYQIEQVTLDDGTKIIRVGATDIATNILGEGAISGGYGGFIFYQTGVAGILKGNIVLDVGNVISFEGELAFRINTTGQIIDQTITVNSKEIRVKFETGEGNLKGFSGTNATLTIGDYLRLSGDYSIAKVDTGLATERTLIGAKNVELFLGKGPAELESGDRNPDAVGVLVTCSSLGIVKFLDGTYAIMATGNAGVIGLGAGFVISGQLSVKINTSGRIVNDTVNIPDSGSVVVAFASNNRIEMFEGQVSINIGNVFKLETSAEKNVTFTRKPTGEVDVAVPEATVSINIPRADGSEQEIFSITGSANFSLGGGQGFRLQDIKVSGFSIFGIGATMAAPAIEKRTPTADLSLPYDGGVFDRAELNTRGYIDVVFNDPNSVGIKESSITDDTSEFILTLNGAAPAGVTINGRATKIATNIFRYTFSGQFAEDGQVALKFLPMAFADESGVNNVVETERFTLATKASEADPLPSIVPVAILSNPTSGAQVNLTVIRAKSYVDVTFIGPDGYALDIASIDGTELTITGAGAGDARFSGYKKLSETTYRYTITDKNTANEIDVFASGEVTIKALVNTFSFKKISDPTQVLANIESEYQFTVQSDAQDMGAANTEHSIGPLVIVGPSIGIAGVTFNKGNLVLTIAIGADEARLAFGGADSAVSTTLTGILGTFDMEVDVLKLLSGNVGSALTVPGNFAVKIETLEIKISDIVRVNAKGIEFGYDPNYDPAANGGEAQKIFEVKDFIGISFDRIKVAGVITSTAELPALTVRTNGFKIGSAILAYGVTLSGAGELTHDASDGPAIKLGSILEFDDIRIGITNFEVVYGSAVDFNGEIFIASGGAKFFPGSPVSVIIKDRLTAETTDVSGIADTEALRATLEFEHGQVKAFKFSVDTIEVKLSKFVTLSGVDIILDTGAADNEEMLHVGSVSATVAFGSVVIGGEGRNFAFLGDGSFKALPGFGVFLILGGATADSFVWPSWLPIKISKIGIEWADIEADPDDFVLTLSATVTGIKGVSGLNFSGTVDDIKIDLGLLMAGQFPIVDIGAIGVGVKGRMFGGEIDAALIGGILKLDALGNIIDSFDTVTKIDARIMFMGLQGGFKFAGMGGFSIRLALSELGPLGVFINVTLPAGIPIGAQTGIAINDFSAGVEFFTTLPSIDDPFKLRDPVFGLPTDVTVDTWLSQVKQQVATQYLTVKANPGLGGFLAAFTSPMTITGSGKIFDNYTSKETFNGQVMIKFSTDGKFLVVGKLNFAADNISISGRLYADLSKIAAGDITILFLADIPDQVRVFTAYGKLKMGFKDASGNEVEFTTVDLPGENPEAALSGPYNEATVGIGTLNNRGYLDVRYIVGAGCTLDKDSILDLQSEFDGATGAGGSIITPDLSQRPVAPSEDLNANTYVFRYWINGNYESEDTVVLTFKDNSWFYIDASGTQVGNVGGTVTVLDYTTANVGYIDIKYRASKNNSLNESSITDLEQEFAINGTGKGSIQFKNAAPLKLPGTDIYRYYLTGDFIAGDISIVFSQNTWGDNLKTNSAYTESFTIVAPVASISDPFTGAVTDVSVLNGKAKTIDIIYTPTPGSSLDYASILDAAAEFTMDMGGISITVGTAPVPVVLEDKPFEAIIREVGESDVAFNARLASSINSYVIITKIGDETDSEFYTRLSNAGITRFRYTLTLPDDKYVPGIVTLSFIEGSWQDTNSSVSAAEIQVKVEGPTAQLNGPFEGGTIDINTLNNRHYIDVELPAPPAGYLIDPASITDTGAEFKLSGPGLGTVALDSIQAPILVSGERTYRYWLNGVFSAGDVTLSFVPGSWSYVNPNATDNIVVTISNAILLNVTIPTAPAGYELDPVSVTDLLPEITLTHNSGKTIELLDTEAPVRIGGTNTFSYRIRGNYAYDGTETVTVSFITGSWSFIKTGQTFDPITIVNPAQYNEKTYLDVIYYPTLNNTLKLTSIDGDEFAFDPACTASDDVTISGLFTRLPGTNVFRYYVSGKFATGNVSVNFVQGNFEDTLYSNLTSSQVFTVEGTTANLADSLYGSIVGLNQLNNRGYIDVSLNVPAGMILNSGSVTDLDPEFVLSGAGAASVLLDSTQAPVLIDNTMNKYRFWVKGSYTSGDVIITFISGAWSYANDAGVTADSTFAGTAFVATPSTINRHYIDISYKPSSGEELDASSIIDGAPEFSLSGAGTAGVVLSGNIPTLLPGTMIYRYYFDGAFTEGAVNIDFIAGTWQDITTTNLAQTKGFTIVALTASVVDPGAVSSIDRTTLNTRKYIDISFNTIAGTALNAASVIDATPEFILSGTGKGTAALDPSVAPVLVDAATNTYRYTFTGAFVTGTVAIEFIEGSWSDSLGNTASSSTQSFNVMEEIGTADSSGRSFMIMIQGGIELQALGLLEEPLLEIRGQVIFDLNFERKVFAVDMSGTVKVYKLGNIASGAGRFILDASDKTDGTPQFWGVVKLQTNFAFLEQYGVFITGEALLQINTTSVEKVEALTFEGIPGDVLFQLVDLSLISSLPIVQLQRNNVSQAWKDLFALPANGGIILGAGATVESTVAGQKWRIIDGQKQ